MNTTEAATRELPRYKCHKEVSALKIKQVRLSPGGGAEIEPVEDGYAKFDVDHAYLLKHEPKPGGYYIVYEGGYKSYSPANAFERGYTRADE